MSIFLKLKLSSHVPRQGDHGEIWSVALGDMAITAQHKALLSFPRVSLSVIVNDRHLVRHSSSMSPCPCLVRGGGGTQVAAQCVGILLQ